MYRLSEGLSAALRSGSPTMLVRLVALWPDGSERQAFHLRRGIVLSGSARADRTSSVRRSATLSVANKDGELSPALSTDILAEGSRMRVEVGALVGGVPELVPMVTGLVAPGTVARMRGATVDVTVRSNLSACEQDAGEALLLAAGTTVPDALRTLWGPVLPWATWLVDEAAHARTLGEDVPVLPSDQRLSVGWQLARDLGCEAYDDREGAIVVRVRPDPMALPVVREMGPPIDLGRGIVRPPVNAQAVEMTGGDGAPVRAVAEVDDPASPIHRTRIGLRHAPVVTSDAIGDPATAMAAARAWLAARSMAADRVDSEAGVDMLDLDPDDVVSWEEPVTRTSGRFAIESHEVQLGPGTVKVAGVAVLPLFLEDAGQ